MYMKYICVCVCTHIVVVGPFSAPSWFDTLAWVFHAVLQTPFYVSTYFCSNIQGIGTMLLRFLLKIAQSLIS